MPHKSVDEALKDLQGWIEALKLEAASSIPLAAGHMDESQPIYESPSRAAAAEMQLNGVKDKIEEVQALYDVCRQLMGLPKIYG